jgi:hypothetical protein
MWLGQGPFVLWDIASSENQLVDVMRPFSLGGRIALLRSRPQSDQAKATGARGPKGSTHGT